MKVLHIGKRGMMEKYSAPDSYLYSLEKVDTYMDHSVEEFLAMAGDADFIVADAICRIPGELIERMPNLRLIHSEGVAFNGIDIEAARRRHVYVCNSQGMNATAVAEQTILLMLGMLRNVVRNDRAVREGKQIQTKEEYMRRGDLRELSDCTVGLVGFGNIARKTVVLLHAHGVETILYTKRTPLPPEEEETLGVQFRTQAELLAESDIVSLHLPVNQETAGIADAAFFSAMKDGAMLVNTSRGELVDDSALTEALRSGKLAMAALDTLDHEPVQPDHPLLQVPDEIAERLIFSPHIGGITASSFRRSYAMIWEDIQAAAEGRTPKRVVNPW